MDRRNLDHRWRLDCICGALVVERTSVREGKGKEDAIVIMVSRLYE